MAKQKKSSGIMIGNSVRTSEVTIYTRMGRTIMRSAHSDQPTRRTRAQFQVRMRTRHSNALWQDIRLAKPMFTGEKSAYAQFAALAYKLPTVYVPRNGKLEGATFLMPGIPLSDGSMPVVKQWLGELDGTPALITSLAATELRRGDVLRLYILKQYGVDSKPLVGISFREFKPKGWNTATTVDGITPRLVDGRLAMTGECFADDMMGWALVHISGDRCSGQVAVTRCRFYEQFTTEEALLRAAESYGGLTE